MGVSQGVGYVELQLWNSPRPALVDPQHADLAKLRWRLDGRGYVIRYSEKRIHLTHALMGRPPVGHAWDHINRDKLDNRFANLRLLSNAENAQNKNAYRCNVTGIRGVFYRKDTGRFMAHACVHGKKYRLGYYDTPEEAAAIAAKFRREHMPYSEEALSHG